MKLTHNLPKTPLESWINQKISCNQPELERSQLEAYQLNALRNTIRLVRQKSAFYQELLANAPDTLTCLEDLRCFPFTTADDLRLAGLQLLCVSQGDIQRVVTLDTSGTTGKPKRLYFTRQDQELTIDFFQHGMSVFTEPGDRVMILLPFERPGSVGDLLAAGLRRLGATPVFHGPVSDPERALATIQAEKINGLVGAPTHVLALARFSTLSFPAQRWFPSQVLLTTDHVPVPIVETIHSIWGSAVYNHYGMTEMGLGGGVDCQARIGYHLREADLYVEIIDPGSDQPMVDGQPGEIVFTTLTRKGMPLIRYRTGDISSFLSQPCPCGTILKTMQHLRFRHAGLVPLGIGDQDKLTMADLDNALFSLSPVLNFSASMTGNYFKACLNLDVVLMPGTPGDWCVQVEKALEDIPAVRAARQARQLDFQVVGQEYQISKAGSLAKRKILDRRSQ